MGGREREGGDWEREIGGERDGGDGEREIGGEERERWGGIGRER